MSLEVLIVILPLLYLAWPTFHTTHANAGRSILLECTFVFDPSLENQFRIFFGQILTLPVSPLKCSDLWLDWWNQSWCSRSFEGLPLFVVCWTLHTKTRQVYYKLHYICLCFFRSGTINPYHLTFLLHPNHWGHWSWLTCSHFVVSTDSETVLLMRLQSGAHPVWGALTLGCELFPIPRLSSVLYFNHVAQDGTATVVAGARPGEHEACGRHEGDDGAGGRRLRPLWWDDGE